jgi:hypothetical protein
MKSTSIVILLAFCCVPFFLSAQQVDPNSSAQQMLNKSSHNFFIENKGQWSKEVRYLAKIGGMNAWITQTGVVYDYYQTTRNYKPEETMKLPRNEKEEFERQHTSMKGHVVDMVLEGANTEAKSVPSGMQEGYYNYFIGNDSTKWASFVRLYSEVLIQDIYPGIDIRYYFDNGLIRYDYIAKPGADLAQINLKIKGSDGYSINEKGELTLKTSLGKITHGKLFAYQNNGNKKTEIACSFFKNRNGKIGVSAEYYNPALALVIDPLVYSTFIGGSQADESKSIKIDGSGNAYITGNTGSTDYPTTTGAYDISSSAASPYYLYDVFITKLNASGSALIYSTFIGGNDYDWVYSIATDNSGNTFITGNTKSADYPTTSGAYDKTYNGTGQFGEDVIVTKLNSTGSVLSYSTFIGGSGQDIGYSLAIDGIGNAFITGITNSSNFPTTTGAYNVSFNGNGEIFVIKLNITGSACVYSTFINDGQASSIVVDGSGNAYIAGSTGFFNFPTTTGAYDVSFNGNDDVFVTKLNATGSALVYSTFIGGSDNDGCNSMAIDGSGNAFLTGFTDSHDFPTTAGAYDVSFRGAFITKLNASGSALVYSTFLGGSKANFTNSIVIDGSGNAFVTGYTNSSDYPITIGTYDKSYNGGNCDVFLSKLNNSGTALLYSTYLGGSNNEGGSALAIDSNSNVFIIGSTNSTNYPTTTSAYDVSLNSNGDVFVTKIQINNSATYFNPATDVYFDTVTNTNATCFWTKGGGTKRAVFLKQTATGMALPFNKITYTANKTFGIGSQIGSTGWYCVYNDTGSSVTINGLLPNTTYGAMVCEYIWSPGNEYYNTDSATNNPRYFTTPYTTPTIQAYNVIFSNYASSSFTASWNNGNGAFRVVFVCAGNTGVALPVDYSAYNANTKFGSGTQIGSTGWYCVYNGNGSTVNISGLTSNKTYRLMVCEYNGVAFTYSELYNTNTATHNPENYYPKPTIQASGILFSKLTAKSMDISWNKGNGTKRAIFIKASSSGSALPVDNTSYNANSVFGSGSQIGTTGWYCVYNDTGRVLNITGLQQNTNYTLMACEYNGTAGSEIYNSSNATNNPNSSKTLVGISERHLSDISIYPNPTNGLFTIENAKGCQLTIFNSLGKTIYNGIVNDNSFTTDLNNVTDGIYFLKLERNGSFLCQKIVLRR